MADRMADKWLELDEIENSIDNLEMAAYFLEDITSEKKWKWEIIAIHRALYGFLICALRGTAPSLTVLDKDKDSVKAICLHTNGVPEEVIATSFGVSPERVKKWLAEPCLINIHEALHRIKKEDCLPRADCKPLKTSHEEEKAIQKLITEFRNEFEHFDPKYWAIEVSGMPAIVGHILRVIHFIALESNCITFFTGDQEPRIRVAIAGIEEQLTRMAVP